MKIKTSELTGAALDWAVMYVRDPSVANFFAATRTFPRTFSVDWALGGPIIEKERMSIEHMAGAGDAGADVWVATRLEGSSISEEQGNTPLIAAMRCYVAAHLGDEIDVPDELTTTKGETK